MATLSLKLNPKKEDKISSPALKGNSVPVKIEIVEKKKVKFHKPKEKKAKQDSEKFAPIKDAVAWLCERFPKCFSLQNRLPLEIGITNKIIIIAAGEEGSPTPQRLKKTLKWYTRNIQYLDALINQTHRIDLESTPVQEITQLEKDHAQSSRTNLAAFMEKKKTEKEAKAQARKDKKKQKFV